MPNDDSKKVWSVFGIAFLVSVGIIWLVPTDAPAVWGWLTIGYVLVFMFCVWFLVRTGYKSWNRWHHRICVSGMVLALPMALLVQVTRHHSALTHLPSSAVNSNRCPVTHWFRIAFGFLATLPNTSRSPKGGKIHPRFTRSLLVRAAIPGTTKKLEASHLHTNPDSSSPAKTYSSLPLETCRTNRPQRFR